MSYERRWLFGLCSRTRRHSTSLSLSLSLSAKRLGRATKARHLQPNAERTSEGGVAARSPGRGDGRTEEEEEEEQISRGANGIIKAERGREGGRR